MTIVRDESRIGAAGTPYGYPTFELYRLSVEQYHRMIDAGILHPKDRVELLDGIVFAKEQLSRNNPEAPFGHDSPIHRLSVEQYHAMLDAGILTPDDKVELLDGFLAAKMGKNPPHRRADRRVRLAIERVTPKGWYVEPQEPVTFAQSEPEPDVAVIRGESDDYVDCHPGPDDIGVVVEISDTTLRSDQTDKATFYAEARVPYYWLLNIPMRWLEVRSEPSGPGNAPAYGRLEVFGEGDTVPLVLDGVEAGRVAVRDLLP